MSLSNARKSLEIITRDFASANRLRVAYENVQFDGKGEYLECFLLPIEPHLIALQTQQNQAIFQVNFYLNQNESAQKADRLVRDFTKQFKVGGRVGNSIVYKPTARSQGFKQDGKYMVAVSIYFQYEESICQQ